MAKDQKQKLDLDRIGKGLGAVRMGKVHAGGGYFGAMQSAAQVSREPRDKPQKNKNQKAKKI